MKFSFFGAEVRVSFLFCAAVCAVICVDKTGLAVSALLAAAIHETGHLFALWLYDSPPVRIELVPASIRIVKRAASQENAAVTALSGPLTNIAVTLCAGLNWYLYKKTYVLYFAAVNAAVGLFNLLPARGLDGGSILFYLLSKRVSEYTATAITRALSFLLAASAAGVGVYLYIKGRLNISVFFAALYLLFCALGTARE